MDHISLSGGFAEPPQTAAMAFRAIMQAMARPGTIQDISGAVPPAPMSKAAGTVVMTLCDPDTGIFLAGHYHCAAICDWIRFHTGAPVVAPQNATFVLGHWSDIDLATLPTGTPEYPDRSATVIVEQPSLDARGATLRGPGIKDSHTLNLPDRAAFQRNAALFPLGLDFIFASGTQIAALPRSTQVS